MLHKIMSIQNPYIKWVRTLLNKKGRNSENKFLIEGMKVVTEVLNNQYEIHSLIIDEEIYESSHIVKGLVHSEKYPVYLVSKSIMATITDTKNSQGIAAVVSCFNNQPLLNKETIGNFVTIIDHIQDPGNLGTIIRTADAAGVTSIFLSEGTVDIYNPKVVRSTMGSLFHVSLFPDCILTDTIGTLKKCDYTIIASSLNGEDLFSRLYLNEKPVALIVGNESKGVCNELLMYADYLYKIPMIGKAESLNASVAAGIMIYDIVRGRQK